MKADERLLQYAAFDTTSDENSTTVPSTPNQLKLAAFIRDELERLGVEDPVMSETGYVYGWLPASEGCEDLPCIGLIAHMDTSDGASGADIKPRYLHYEGGDIILNDRVKTTVEDFPFLNDMVGQTLIVTDGTTLLGADDKAGCAEIVTLAEYLIAHPEDKHGRIALGFTPDEEIGRGPDHFDVKGFGADFAYTVDGGLLGELEYENFNAAGGRVTFHGNNIHPGSAKNKMKNAVTIAADFLKLFPESETPEHTEGYEGFYHFMGIKGDVTTTVVSFILRDHDLQKLEEKKSFVAEACEWIDFKYGDGTAELSLRDSYYNMKELIVPHMEIVERAKEAMLRAGVTPVIQPIRGGTDGATLSYKGLLCPNLSTGGANFHGVRELVSVDAMEKMVEILKNIVTAG